MDNVGSLQESESIKQIDACAIGPLRCVSALKGTSLLKATKVATFLARLDQHCGVLHRTREKGGDYGHPISRAACNMCGVLMAEELKNDQVPMSFCILIHHSTSTYSTFEKAAHARRERAETESNLATT